MPDYVGTREISGMLGLSRKYVTDRVVKRQDFPGPAMRISRKVVLWRRSDVERWLRSMNKEATR